MDRTNATVAAITIVTMMILNTLVRIGRYHVGIVGVSWCDQIVTAANARIVNMDRTNATVAAITIVTMVILNTLVRIGRYPVGIIGVTWCDQIVTAALGR